MPAAALVRFSLSASGQARLPFATENFQDIQHMPHAAVKEDPLRLFVLLHCGDFEQVERSMGECARGVKPWLGQYRILPAPDAPPRWLRTCLVPHMGDGELVGYGLICDVTGEVENVRAMRTLADAGGPGIGVFRASAECRYLQVNQRYAEICGYGSPEELLLCSPDVAGQFGIHPEECEAVLSMVNEHGAVQRYAMELRRSDGAVRWISLNLRRALDPQGGVAWYEGICADITEQVERDLGRGRVGEFERTSFGEGGAEKPAGIPEDTGGLCPLLAYVRDAILWRVRVPVPFGA